VTEELEKAGEGLSEGLKNVGEGIGGLFKKKE